MAGANKASDVKSAAPDVDLASQGLPTSYLLLAAAGVLGLALYVGRYSATGEGNDMSLTWLVQALFTGLLWTFQLLAVIVLLLLLLLIFRQRMILYVPTPPGVSRSPKENPRQYRSPGQWNMPFEDLRIPTEDGVAIHAWFIYHTSATRGQEIPYTIIYFHGNAGNIGHRLENLYEMFDKLKVNLLVVDYRGYGDSEDGGGPSEKGFLLDAWATYRWLLDRAAKCTDAASSSGGADGPKVSTERIIFFGRSIGGCVGIRLAAQLLERRLQAQKLQAAHGAPAAELVGAASVSSSSSAQGADDKLLPLPAGLILENTLTSVREMACQIFPFLSVLGPVLRWPIIWDEWRSAESLKFFADNHKEWCCCFLSGLKDEIVPPEQMQQLNDIMIARRCRVLEFFGFEEGGHNDTPHRGGAMYWTSLKTFMSQVADTEELRRRSLQEAENQ